MQRAYTAKKLFSHDKHGEKRAQCYRWAHEDYSVCSMCRKCKIVSYVMRYLLSHIRTPFLFYRKVTCPHIFCSETSMLLQTVFVTVSE
jgi:hypothetical protein